MVTLQRPLPSSTPSRRLGTKVVLTTDHLKQVVSEYLDHETFAFDVETVAKRRSRLLAAERVKVEQLAEQRRKKTKDADGALAACQCCGNQHDRRSPYCSEVCKKAATKDKPALDHRTNSVWAISLAAPGRCDVIPMGHPLGPPQLLRAEVFEALEPLFFSDRRKINQNIKFDLLSIAKYYGGEIPPPPYGDTLVASFLLNENLPNYKLETLARAYVGYTYAEKLGEQAYHVDFERAMRYSIIDAKMAWMVWSLLQECYEERPKLQWLFDLEMDVLGVLLDMESYGSYVDVEWLRTSVPKLEAQMRATEQKVWELAGERFNLRSSVQRRKFFYETLGLQCDFFTDKGAESTSAPALRRLARSNKVAKALLEYSDIAKLLSTYILGYLPHVDDDSRIRASFNQALPKTGRFSCSAPNLQNIPVREKESYESRLVRRMFCAPAGYKLIVADFSQIELRVLAHHCQDPMLLKAYREDIDLHTQTAALIYGVGIEEVTKEQRAIGKAANFSFAYEGSPMTIVERAGISEGAARKVHAAWHEAYPAVQRWGSAIKDFCYDNEFVETLYGRKRRLQEIRSGDNRLRAYAERQAVNHPIQGGAADLAKIAMVQIHDAVADYDAHLVLQIHDEFIVEVVENKVDDVVPLIRDAMEQIDGLDGRPALTVPLVADISVGLNWGDIK